MRAALLVPVVFLITPAPRTAAGPAGPDAPLATPPTATFRSDAQVVLLDMVVRDGRDRPVLDLRGDEVEVFEDGRRCEIVSFRLVRADTAAAAPAHRGVEEPTTADTAAATAGSASAATRPALVLLVFDQLSGDAERRARAAGERFAASSFPPGTLFAVFKAGLGLRVLQPFTTNRELLAPAIRTATSIADATDDPKLGFDPNLNSTSGTEHASRMLAREGGIMTHPRSTAGSLFGTAEPGEIPAGMLYSWSLARRTQQSYGSLDALLAIVKELQPVQGRKTILYFAEGLQATADARGLVETTVAEANRSNVTFYAVDARGLTTDRPDIEAQAALDAAGALASHAPTGEIAPVRQEILLADAVNNTQGNLGVLARDTGGFLIANTDNLRPALERVAAEVRSYYEAVYVPANPAQDGRFHRIEARVSRPHVTLRTRSGYFATRAGAPTLSARELPLMAALAAAEPRRDFAVETGTLGFRPLNGERESLVLVQVPLAGVQLDADEATGTYRGHLSLLALLEDSSGTVVARLLQDSPLSGPLAEIERRRQGQAVFRQTLRLAPGRYTLRTAVQDVEAGTVSVDRREIVVPAAPAGLALSSLAVVRRTASPGGESVALDPLRVGDVAIAPALARAILPGDSRALDYFVTVYPSGGPEPLELTLALRQDGRRVARAVPALPAVEGDGRVPLLGSLGIDSLGPGTYELIATARQGGAAVEASAEFEIPKTARSAPPAVAPRDDELERVLDRASDYVLEYEQTFANLAAEELYEQSVSGGAQRQTTRAELVFVRLPGDVPWGSLRDVFEVDGRRLREPDGRLERLLARHAADAPARAQAILAESARYNFGPAVRTVNLPTLPLLFLHPRNRHRFAFRRAGSEELLQTEALLVDFAETARPTIVREGGTGADLPASGRLWIDARHGTVLRTETRFRFGSSALATIRTDYRREEKLAAWVPAEMHERYEDLPGGERSVFQQTTETVARYANVRRFDVVTGETAAVPAKP